MVAIPHEAARSDDARQAFYILRFGFTVAPIIAGADKFFHLLVDWDKYVAPWVVNIVHNAHGLMLAAGVVEIIAGVIVAVKPKFGGYLVAAWLAGIIVNLVTYPGYFDIALRDLGLLLGALALAKLATVYD